MPLQNANATINLFKTALQSRGYSYDEFTLSGSSFTRFTAPSGRFWLTRDAHISYPMVSADCKYIATNKNLSYELCAHAGITVPQTISTSDLYESRDAIAALLAGHVVVVKPNDASLSWGLTLNVRTQEQVELAVKHARQYCKKVIIQQQVTGQEVRFIVVNGKVRAALLRQTAHVCGDGKKTLEQLIAEENQARSAIKDSMAPYPQLNSDIIDFDALDISRVPADGEFVELGRSGMIRGGASIYNIIDSIDNSYMDIATKAAKALSSPFVAVDIMIQDYSQPCRDDNYAFIEFNSAPVLALCYSARDGKQYDVVSDLLPLIETAMGVAAS